MNAAERQKLEKQAATGRAAAAKATAAEARLAELDAAALDEQQRLADAFDEAFIEAYDEEQLRVEAEKARRHLEKVLAAQPWVKAAAAAQAAAARVQTARVAYQSALSRLDRPDPTHGHIPAVPAVVVPNVVAAVVSRLANIEEAEFHDALEAKREAAIAGGP